MIEAASSSSENTVEKAGSSPEAFEVKTPEAVEVAEQRVESDIVMKAETAIGRDRSLLASSFQSMNVNDPEVVQEGEQISKTFKEKVLGLKDSFLSFTKQAVDKVQKAEDAITGVKPKTVEVPGAAAPEEALAPVAIKDSFDKSKDELIAKKIALESRSLKEKLFSRNGETKQQFDEAQELYRQEKLKKMESLSDQEKIAFIIEEGIQKTEQYNQEYLRAMGAREKTIAQKVLKGVEKTAATAATLYKKTNIESQVGKVSKKIIKNRLIDSAFPDVSEGQRAAIAHHMVSVGRAATLSLVTGGSHTVLFAVGTALTNMGARELIEAGLKKYGGHYLGDVTEEKLKKNMEAKLEKGTPFDINKLASLENEYSHFEANPTRAKLRTFVKSAVLLGIAADGGILNKVIQATRDTALDTGLQELSERPTLMS